MGLRKDALKYPYTREDQDIQDEIEALSFDEMKALLTEDFEESIKNVKNSYAGDEDQEFWATKSDIKKALNRMNKIKTEELHLMRHVYYLNFIL